MGGHDYEANESNKFFDDVVNGMFASKCPTTYTKVQ